MVELVDIDVVRPQPLEAGVHGSPDVQGGELVVVGPGVGGSRHVPVHLGCEHDLVAALAALREPVADDALGAALVLAPAVHVRRVQRSILRP